MVLVANLIGNGDRGEDRVAIRYTSLPPRIEIWRKVA